MKKKISEMNEEEKYKYHLSKAKDILKKKKEKENKEKDKIKKEILSKIFKGNFDKIFSIIDLNSVHLELLVDGKKIEEILEQSYKNETVSREEIFKVLEN